MQHKPNLFFMKLNSSKTGLKHASQQKGHNQSIQFKDNRPEATAQFKMQEMANQPIQKKENKTGMPDNLKSGIENLSGMDMSDVKVHYNSPQPAQLQAHAFAQGNQIHIASGQEKHLPHEAWHVVQQKQGRVQPTKQLKGKVNINDDSGLEREADLMGTKALQRKGFSIQINTKNNLSSIVQRATSINYHAQSFNYVDSHTHHQTQEIVGNKMSAVLDPNQPIKGSEPGSGVQSGIMSSLKSIGYKRMIRGHLMNGQMGGLGIAANLFPITAQANSKHKSYMENYVKGQLYEEQKKPIHNRDKINYQVQVVPLGHPKDVGWSAIDVAFVCKASTSSGWSHNINIDSNPAKDKNNLGGEGLPANKPPINGRAEGKPPTPWGQADNGYDKYNSDHKKSKDKSTFFWGDHEVDPNDEVYTRGLHFNQGEIDAEKLEVFELFWKLEDIQSPVKLNNHILKEYEIETFSNHQMNQLPIVLKEELD